VSLNIVPSDVLNYMSDIFNSMWVIISIGLGLLATPYLVGIAKTAFRGRRG